MKIKKLLIITKVYKKFKINMGELINEEKDFICILFNDNWREYNKLTLANKCN